MTRHLTHTEFTSYPATQVTYNDPESRVVESFYDLLYRRNVVSDDGRKLPVRAGVELFAKGSATKLGAKEGTNLAAHIGEDAARDFAEQVAARRGGEESARAMANRRRTLDLSGNAAWTSRAQGVRLVKIGNVWLKEVDPAANFLWRADGRLSIEEQTRALAKLGNKGVTFFFSQRKANS